MSDQFVTSLDNSVCSPLLERLKSLTMSDELNRVKAFKLLENIHKSNLKSSEIKSDQESTLTQSHDELNSEALTPFENNSILAQSGSPLVKEVLIDFKNTNNSIFNDNIYSIQDYNPNNERKSNVKINGFRSNENYSVPKQEFLRKGQGLSRYNCKRLKGFRKCGTIKNKNSLPQKDMNKQTVLLVKNKPEESLSIDRTTVKVNKATAQKASSQMTSNLDAFEKLEELIEHDSFVSTSSKVNELLYENNSYCSTPVTHKKSSFGNINFTPILNVNSDNIAPKKYDVSRQTQVCNLFTNTKTKLQFSHVRSEFKETVDYDNFGTGTYLSQQNSDNKEYQIIGINEKGSSNLYKSGILKHCSSPNNCDTKDKISFSVPKVHFPNHGVNVLEYEKELEEPNSATVCSEDSDLINISDLENLQLLGLNYNFEIVHEISASKEEDFSNKISQKTSMNFQKTGQIFGNSKLQAKPHLRDSKTDTISTVYQNKIPLQANMKSLNSCNKISSLKLKETDNCVSKSLLKESKFKNCKVENNDDDTEVKKILLLSRAHELKKEINSFKVKNETLDKLINELKCEKEKLVILQAKEEKTKARTRKKSNSHPVGQKDCATNTLENNVIISTKIEKLNQKLCRLETENNNLKRKVSSLQKKENELKKTQKEIFSDSRNLSDTKKVPVIQNKDKNSCIKKVEFRAYPETIKDSTTSKYNYGGTTGTMEYLSNVVLEETNLNKIKEPVLNNGESSAMATGHFPTGPIYQLDDVLNMDKFVNCNEEFSKTESLCAKPESDTMNELDSRTKILSVNQHPNGDVETNYSDKIVYWYSEDETTHTRFREGKEVIEFKNGQKEIYFSDGSHQISFPDKSCTTVYRDGSQKTISCNGTRTHFNKDGTKVVLFPNGQKEVYLQESVQRIYPDGTVKILHVDGTQETRYRNGRIRIKDKDGSIIMK